MLPSGFICKDGSSTKLVAIEGKPGGWYAPNAYAGEYDYFSTRGEPMTKPASQCQVGGDHYKKLAIQPGEFCEKNGITGMAVDAIGYICREHVLDGGDGNRGGAQDLKKAIHCLNLRLQWKYGEAYESESKPTEVTSDPLADTQEMPAVVLPALHPEPFRPFAKA